MNRNMWKKFSSRSNSGQHFCSNADELTLELQIHKLQYVEDSCKKIIKNAKKYEESLKYLCKSEVKMMSDFSNSELCHIDDELRGSIENWHTIAIKLESLCPALANVMQKTVVEPVKRYFNFLSGFHAALRRREYLLQECYRCQSKLEKLFEKEKTAQVVLKIDQAKKSVEVATEEFQNQNRSLMDELPIVYDSRIEYMLPCLEALIRGQVSLYGEAAQTVHAIVVDSPAKSTISSDDIVERKLSEIKNLSIVGNDC